ncbi:MAG: hypothetical protein J7K64_06225, partial [Bacteroidales bacterium]|nr:hypothetical protein [Bacteroidales bacterium]
VYDRTKSGQILLMTLNCGDVNNLEEGTYTSSGTEVRTFIGSYMLLDINYFSEDYLYYESYNGTVEVKLTGVTYEFEVNMTTTAGENVSAYYLGHLKSYNNKSPKETDIKEFLNFQFNKEKTY